jgi:uncharacterized protein YbaP (TraB family)
MIAFLGAIAAASALAAEPACPPAVAPPAPDQITAALPTARDRGVLWTIEKDGRQSWLYGTIHIGNLDTAVPGRKVLQALRAADVFAVELDVTDPVTRQALLAPPTGPQGSAFPPALLERLQAQARRACLPWEPLSKMPPLLVGSALTLLDARWDGHGPGYASERILSDLARSMKKPIRSLESTGIHRGALAGDTAEAQVKTLEAFVTGLEQDRVRPVLKRLVKAWSDGDFATIVSYDQWCGCASTPEQKAALDRMAFDRNQELAAGVDALHRDGKRVFAAVGILHMVGDRGLPTLLEKLGYNVQRVSFDPQP